MLLIIYWCVWLNKSHYEHCKTQQDGSIKTEAESMKLHTTWLFIKVAMKKKNVSHKAADSSRVGQCSCAIQARHSLPFATHQWSILGPSLLLQICCPAQCWVLTSSPYRIFLYAVRTLYSHFFSVLPTRRFPGGFSTKKSVCFPSLTHPRHTPCQIKTQTIHKPISDAKYET